MADSHPELLESSEDLEFGEIPCDEDLEKILEDGFEFNEISQNELAMLDVKEDEVVESPEFPIPFVKIVPVDLGRYGIKAEDYIM